MSIQLAFYFDQTRCMGCNACTVACKDWNQVNPGPVRWRKQETYEFNGNFFPFSMGCNHCEDPVCMKSCPANAITKSEDGIVTINRADCKGYKICITACPFAKPMIADDKQEPNAIVGWQIQHPAQKCNMCQDQLNKGEKPACVLSCVGRALDFGTLESLQAKYPNAVRLNKTDFPYVYVNQSAPDTKPSILINKKAGIKIHKSTIYNGK